MKGPFARLTAALVAAASMPACASSTIVSPAPQPTPGVTLTIQQQNAEANAALAVTNGIRFASLFAALFRIHVAGAAPQALPCKDGVELRVTYPTPDNIDVILNVFYDKQCVHPLVKSAFVLFNPIATAQLTGKSIAYDRAGHRVAYGSIKGTAKLSSTENQATITGTISTTPSGSPVMSFGLSCALPTAAGATNDCGFGAITGTVPNVDLGFTTTLRGFVGSGTTNDGRVNVQAYSGKPGSLKLAQGKGNAWVVSGGTTVVHQTGRFSEAVNDKTFLVKLHLSLTDKLADAGALVLLNHMGAGGFVNQTSLGRAAASFGTDPIGQGTIQYSDGSTGKIVFFIVLLPS